MNKIIIKLDKTLTTIAGNDFGREIYLTQVKEYIKLDEVNEIIFPDYIKRAAISFIQGFTEQIFEEFGYDKYFELFTIKGSDTFVKRFDQVID